MSDDLYYIAHADLDRHLRCMMLSFKVHVYCLSFKVHVYCLSFKVHDVVI